MITVWLFKNKHERSGQENAEITGKGARGRYSMAVIVVWLFLVISTTTTKTEKQESKYERVQPRNRESNITVDWSRAAQCYEFGAEI